MKLLCIKVSKPTNEWVHRFSSAAHDHSDEDEARSHESDIAATEQVGKGTDERANAGKRDKIGQDKPNPAIGATNVAVDVRWDTTYDYLLV